MSMEIHPHMSRRPQPSQPSVPMPAARPEPEIAVPLSFSEGATILLDGNGYLVESRLSTNEGQTLLTTAVDGPERDMKKVLKVLNAYMLTDNTCSAGERWERLERRIQKVALCMDRDLRFFRLDDSNMNVAIMSDYVEGVNLEKGLESRQAPLTEAQTWKMLRQTLTQLKPLHLKDVIHYDVKASNMIETPGENYVLIDFGLALIDKSVKAETITLSVRSSPVNYRIAPIELAKPWQDLYALGRTGILARSKEPLQRIWGQFDCDLEEYDLGRVGSLDASPELKGFLLRLMGYGGRRTLPARIMDAIRNQGPRRTGYKDADQALSALEKIIGKNGSEVPVIRTRPAKQKHTEAPLAEPAAVQQAAPKPNPYELEDEVKNDPACRGYVPIFAAADHEKGVKFFADNVLAFAKVSGSRIPEPIAVKLYSMLVNNDVKTLLEKSPAISRLSQTPLPGFVASQAYSKMMPFALLSASYLNDAVERMSKLHAQSKEPLPEEHVKAIYASDAFMKMILEERNESLPNLDRLRTMARPMTEAEARSLCRKIFSEEHRPSFKDAALAGYVERISAFVQNIQSLENQYGVKIEPSFMELVQMDVIRSRHSMYDGLELLARMHYKFPLAQPVWEGLGSALLDNVLIFKAIPKKLDAMRLCSEMPRGLLHAAYEKIRKGPVSPPLPGMMAYPPESVVEVLTKSLPQFNCFNLDYLGSVSAREWLPENAPGVLQALDNVYQALADKKRYDLVLKLKDELKIAPLPEVFGAQATSVP